MTADNIVRTLARGHMLFRERQYNGRWKYYVKDAETGYTRSIMERGVLQAVRDKRITASVPDSTISRIYFRLTT